MRQELMPLEVAGWYFPNNRMRAVERARALGAKYPAEVSRAVRCSRCDHPAVIDQPYRGAHACAAHFIESVDDRIRTEFHRQLPKFARGTLAVALSGGKDSAVALAATHHYFARRPTVRIVAVTVDEGIAGYRLGTIESARRLTEQLGVEHRIVSMETELGTTTDRTAREHPETVPCSYCGVWRRRLLNGAARDLGADALILGFNLDDLAQTVLMNLARGEIDRLVRMAPHRSRLPGSSPGSPRSRRYPSERCSCTPISRASPSTTANARTPGGRSATSSGTSSGSSKRRSPGLDSRSCAPASASWSTSTARKRERPRVAGAAASPRAAPFAGRASSETG